MAVGPRAKPRGSRWRAIHAARPSRRSSVGAMRANCSLSTFNPSPMLMAQPIFGRLRGRGEPAGEAQRDDGRFSALDHASLRLPFAEVRAASPTKERAPRAQAAAERFFAGVADLAPPAAAVAAREPNKAR